MYVPYLSPCSTSFKYIATGQAPVDIGPGAKLKRYRRLMLHLPSSNNYLVIYKYYYIVHKN